MIDFDGMIKYLEALKNKHNFINYGDKLSENETKQLAEILKNYNISNIKKCFGDYIDDTKKFEYVLQCYECGLKYKITTGKDKLFENIKLYNKNLYKCCDCVRQEKEERNLEYVRNRLDNQKLAIECFNILIDSNISWKNDYNIYNKINNIKFCMYYINKQDRYEIVSSLEYRDYLKTPYWKAISEYKKLKNNTCQLCGTDKNLNVHHSNYNILGDELNNMNELTVLCKDCHYKFHKKGE